MARRPATMMPPISSIALRAPFGVSTGRDFCVRQCRAIGSSRRSVVARRSDPRLRPFAGQAQVRGQTARACINDRYCIKFRAVFGSAASVGETRNADDGIDEPDVRELLDEHRRLDS